MNLLKEVLPAKKAQNLLDQEIGPARFELLVLTVLFIFATWMAL